MFLENGNATSVYLLCWVLCVSPYASIWLWQWNFVCLMSGSYHIYPNIMKKPGNWARKKYFPLPFYTYIITFLLFWAALLWVGSVQNGWTVLANNILKYKYKREDNVFLLQCIIINFCSFNVTCCVQTSRALHWLWGPIWIPKPHVSQWQCAWIFCKWWL